jgi:hypothetical protein
MTADTTPQGWNPPPPPINDLNNAISQLNEANSIYNADYGMLQSMITQMIGLAKEGKVGEAFQIAEQDVMPVATQVQGDSMGQLAASMNISSACQSFITDAQNGVNYITGNPGAAGSGGAAGYFAFCISYLYKQITNEMALPKSQQWMDPTTAQNFLQTINSICGQFYDPTQVGKKTVNVPLTPNTILANSQNVANELEYWVNNPTSMDNGKTGQQNLQDLQANMTQLNNTVSAQSQGLQAQEQFASNTFNQYMNSCQGVFASSQAQAQNMVQNQKSQ